MNTLRNNLLDPAAVLCIVLQFIVFMPHHHHTDRGGVCINFSHLLTEQHNPDCACGHDHPASEDAASTGCDCPDERIVLIPGQQNAGGDGFDPGMPVITDMSVDVVFPSEPASGKNVRVDLSPPFLEFTGIHLFGVRSPRAPSVTA